jgi:hypothetical protein
MRATDRKILAALASSPRGRARVSDVSVGSAQNTRNAIQRLMKTGRVKRLCSGWIQLRRK